MVFDFKRIFSGLILITILTASYYLHLDNLIYFFLLIFSIYDLLKSKILPNKINFIYLTIFLLFILFFSYLFNYINYLFIVEFILIFLIILNKDNLRYYFFLSILIFLAIFIQIGISDRNLFYQIFMIAFLNDTTAYVFGRVFKGPKIIPSISPNKTWSGTIFSFFITLNILIFYDFKLFFAIFLSLSLFFGDILFSYVKRKIHLKDFSNLIQGHGGILDRIDSIFLFVIFYQFMNSISRL